MQIKCIYEKIRYLKSLVHDSVIVCDKIISVTDSVSANMTNYYIIKCHKHWPCQQIWS